MAGEVFGDDGIHGVLEVEAVGGAIGRAAVYVAMQPQWMESNDSNQCESEECDS